MILEEYNNIIWNYEDTPGTDTELETDVLIDEDDGHVLVLFNDDVNTFDHVITCLVEICEHEELQAEQCAWLVHLKGKCKVKHGSYDDLEPKCTALLDKGLTAEIA